MKYFKVERSVIVCCLFSLIKSLYLPYRYLNKSLHPLEVPVCQTALIAVVFRFFAKYIHNDPYIRNNGDVHLKFSGEIDGLVTLLYSEVDH